MERGMRIVEYDDSYKYYPGYKDEMEKLIENEVWQRKTGKYDKEVIDFINKRNHEFVESCKRIHKEYKKILTEEALYVLEEQLPTDYALLMLSYEKLNADLKEKHKETLKNAIATLEERLHFIEDEVEQMLEYQFIMQVKRVEVKE